MSSGLPSRSRPMPLDAGDEDDTEYFSTVGRAIKPPAVPPFRNHWLKKPPIAAPFWRVSYTNHHGHTGSVYARLTVPVSHPISLAHQSADGQRVQVDVVTAPQTPTSYDMVEVPLHSRLPSVHSMGSLVFVGSPDSRSTAGGGIKRIPSDFSFGSLAPTPTMGFQQAMEDQQPGGPDDSKTPTSLGISQSIVDDMPSMAASPQRRRAPNDPPLPCGTTADGTRNATHHETMQQSTFAFALAEQRYRQRGQAVVGLSERPWSRGTRASGPAFVSRALAIVLDRISQTLRDDGSDDEDFSRPITPPNSETDEASVTAADFHSRRFSSAKYRPTRKRNTPTECSSSSSARCHHRRGPRDPILDSFFFRPFRGDDSTTASSIASPCDARQFDAR